MPPQPTEERQSVPEVAPKDMIWGWEGMSAFSKEKLGRALSATLLYRRWREGKLVVVLPGETEPRSVVYHFAALDMYWAPREFLSLWLRGQHSVPKAVTAAR